MVYAIVVSLAGKRWLDKADFHQDIRGQVELALCTGAAVAWLHHPGVRSIANCDAIVTDAVQKTISFLAELPIGPGAAAGKTAL